VIFGNSPRKEGLARGPRLAATACVLATQRIGNTVFLDGTAVICLLGLTQKICQKTFEQSNQ
jgi:hypothetical protein